MKKVMLIILMILCFASFGYAQEPIAFAPAIEGQFIYDMQSGQIVPAVGLQIARAYDGIIEARALATGDPESISELDKIGVGLGVNLPKLATKAGVEWVAKVFNPSVGIAGLYDLQEGNTSLGVYVVIVKVEF